MGRSVRHLLTTHTLDTPNYTLGGVLLYISTGMEAVSYTIITMELMFKCVYDCMCVCNVRRGVLGLLSCCIIISTLICLVGHV